MKIELGGFLEFVDRWNDSQRLTRPTIHTVMARFLVDALGKGYRRIYLVAFRSSGKSTMLGLLAAYMLKCEPDLRIMVLTADGGLSAKMVRFIRSVLEGHPDTKGLLPKRSENSYQWTQDQFTVNRRAVWRDPSVLARAIRGNYTGSRADVILGDDIEVPTTANSSHKRENLRDYLSEAEYVLSPKGSVILIGTPHARRTIYAAAEELGDG